MDNVIQFQSRKQQTEKTRQEIYEEMAREGAALDNIQIIDVSPEESRLYQEAYEAEFQMQLDLITDRYNRMQKSNWYRTLTGSRPPKRLGQIRSGCSLAKSHRSDRGELQTWNVPRHSGTPVPVSAAGDLSQRVRPKGALTPILKRPFRSSGGGVLRRCEAGRKTP